MTQNELSKWFVDHYFEIKEIDGMKDYIEKIEPKSVLIGYFIGWIMAMLSFLAFYNLFV